jgi:hypothetical protein
LPDFSWQNIPNLGTNTKMATKYSKRP